MSRWVPAKLWLVIVFLVVGSQAIAGRPGGAEETGTRPGVILEQYGFESGVEGWRPSSDSCGRAIRGVAQSRRQSRGGSYSLEMAMDLDGGDACKLTGEAFVNMGENPPPAGQAPLNLEGVTITAWLYAPPGARGDADQPNGVHLFVKDENGRGFYGTWQNIVEGGWFQVSLKVGREAPVCGQAAREFDPTRVSVVGIRIGTAAGSTTKYSGAIYLDSVGWGDLPVLVSDHRYSFDGPTAQKYFPRWGLDPGQGALGLGPPEVISSSLAMRANFGPGGEAQHKGYVGIVYAPHLNLSNKTHQVLQADVRFDPAPSGSCPFVATMWVYDGSRGRSYFDDYQQVGGAGWNTLVFDLADRVQYSPAITGPIPISGEQVEKVGIQLWTDKAYSGTVYIDNVVVGGVEVKSRYPIANQGIVTVSGTQFMLNGRVFRFAGANAEYFFTEPDSKVEEVLRAARDWKLGVVRTWGFGEGCESPGACCAEYSPYFQPARGVWNETAFEHLDRIVAMAGRLGIRLIIPLVNNWEHYGGMPQYMKWVLEERPGSLPTGVITGTDQFHDLFYTNLYARQWYKDFVAHLVGRTNSVTGIRYAEDPTIFSWELSNEPRVKSDVSGRTMHQWLKEMSEFVRGMDPNHMIGTGEEGWFLMPKARADDSVGWQTFPRNYWQYGVNWMDADGTNWGSNGTDFVSDHRSVTTTVSWQDCVDVYQSPPRCDTSVRAEERAGLGDISYATFRMYIDEHESNLFRAPYCYDGFDSILCNERYDYPYDQVLLSIDQHLRAAHEVIGKPVILEEFGIHTRGYVYGGGDKKYHRRPPYTEEHRRRIWQKYYDAIYEGGMNGSLFWNLGYAGMREEGWNDAESLANWSIHPNSDAVALGLSGEHVWEGSRSVRFDYDPGKGQGKAFVDLGNLDEDWYHTNRAKFSLQVYNEGDATWAVVAVSTGDELVWHESALQALGCGWNEVVVDVSSEAWKSQKTGWEYTGDIADLDRVRKVSVGVLGYTRPGSVYVDDLRISYDDGFVVYPMDILGSTIMLHACKMAGITCYSVYLPMVWPSFGAGQCQATLTPTSTATPTSTPGPTLTPTKTSTPTNTPTPRSDCSPDPSKYGFEEDVFWVPQTYTDSQAVIAVGKSDRNVARYGCYSMKLTVDLVGGHPNKSKGEAYVDMSLFPPAGVTAPVNLEGKEVTLWVHAPGAAAGYPNKSNGIQVFAKDRNFRNEYGPWFNLYGYTDRWVSVRFTPSRQQPAGGYMDVGFDPTQIVVIGIKIGVGTGSNATYSGPIYVDGVDWAGSIQVH